MHPKRTEISIGERKIIVDLWEKGETFRKISEIVGRTHSSVQRVINNYKTTGILASKPRSGRPSILTTRETRSLVKAVKANPRVTASELAKVVKDNFQKPISVDGVRKIVKKYGYHGRVVRKKPFISRINRIKRLAFAKEHLNKPPEFWKQVIFSDESKFCILGIKDRKMVWRKPGTTLNKENLLPTVKHGGGGVMIWGCMASNGVGNMEFIESIMDKYDYLNILKRNLKQSAEKLGLKNQYYFQQDNDPKHTSEIVKLWLLYNAPKQLRTPSQSPILNPIEHLWDLLERRIRQHTISSKDMLKTIIREEWSKISGEETAKLVNSMQKRLLEIIKRKGYLTSY